MGSSPVTVSHLEIFHGVPQRGKFFVPVPGTKPILVTTHLMDGGESAQVKLIAY